jgi:hypothetical protein
MSATAPEGYVHGWSSKIARSEFEGIFWRRRNGESRKKLAREFGVHPNTISRIVGLIARELGMYDPAGWSKLQQERREESWQHMRDVFDHRDAIRAADVQAAQRQQARLEAAWKEERRQRIRLFNERQRERARADGLV